MLLDVTVGDKATSRHKPPSKSQFCDSGYMYSGNESLLKAIKVVVLIHSLQLILMFALALNHCTCLMLQICPQLMTH